MRERMFGLVDQLACIVEDEELIRHLKSFVEYGSAEDVLRLWTWLKENK